LGVDGPYGQDDVNGLAMLLTGLTEYIGRGFRWHRPIVEPGEHDVLGKTYGDDAVIRPQIDRLFGVLDDLATHPSTARHLCEKMARHFVADDPDPELVAAMVSEYQASGGDLQRITEVMMDHPAAWQQDHPNVKWPLDYVMSTFRAINLPPRVFDNMPWKTVRRVFHAPLVQMGQAWIGANGPDGYPELDERWITPQGLAARLDWALMAPGEILKALPDPRKVAVDALGARLPESVKFAVSASDQRREGLALVLVSPAFQRR
ncbi:MAG: DUF1800 family protein, partial [Planktomarina sp.]